MRLFYIKIGNHTCDHEREENIKTVYKALRTHHLVHESWKEFRRNFDYDWTRLLFLADNSHEALYWNGLSEMAYCHTWLFADCGEYTTENLEQRIQDTKVHMKCQREYRQYERELLEKANANRQKT